MLLSIFTFIRFLIGCFSDEAGSNGRERLYAKLCVGLIIAMLFLGMCGSASAHTGEKTGKRHRKQHKVEKHINQRQKRIARTAKRWTGIPYVFGGASRSGVDCSGLTMRVYGNAMGIALPHSAAAQATFGSHPGWKRIWKVKGLRKGDLMFLANTYKPGISHAMVMVSPHSYVAASSTGTRSSVSGFSSYTYDHFAYGIRPPKLRQPKYRH